MQTLSLEKSVTLNNGVEIPYVGFGTFQVSDHDVYDAVRAALQIAIRSIDTAAAYNNESGVGRAISDSGLKREEVFLTSKVWNSDQGYDNTLAAFASSLEKLKTDYLDLYLIHWPKPLSAESWRAMEKLYHEGKIRAIGVSNFLIHHLTELLKSAKVIPVINQVELHPQLAQPDLVKFCRSHKIAIQAWASLMQGKVFKIPLIGELAAKYGKTHSQVALRWALQQGFVTIPKSTHPARIRENFAIFDFVISDEDMAKLAALNTGERIGAHPDHIDW